MPFVVPLRRLVLGVAVLSATAVGIVTGQPAHASSPPNAIKLWAATMGGDQSLTLEQAKSNAKNFEMVVGRPPIYRPYMPTLRSVAPATKFIVYMNGVYAQESQGTMYPESWYARDAFGRKITEVKQGGNFLMDPTNPLWIASRAERCAGDTLREGWDGCYLDMLGPGSLFDHYATGAPINPATGLEFTMEEWMKATSTLATAVQRANPTRIVTANGLGTGSQYFEPTSGLTKRLLNGIVAANSQGFVRGTSVPVDQFRRPEKWKLDVDMLVEAGGRGKGVMAMTKIWGVPATIQQKNAVLRYTLATFLLGTDGISSYMYFSDDGAEDAYAQVHDVLQRTYVGQPTAPYVARSNGSYTRTFTSGFAAVNPGTASVTIRLDRTMTTTTGVVVTSITLAPNTGEVLTFSAA